MLLIKKKSHHQNETTFSEWLIICQQLLPYAVMLWNLIQGLGRLLVPHHLLKGFFSFFKCTKMNIPVFLFTSPLRIKSIHDIYTPLTTVAKAYSHLPPHWPSGQGIRLETGRSGVRIQFVTGFFQVESYQWLKNWHSSGYPARRLAL